MGKNLNHYTLNNPSNFDDTSPHFDSFDGDDILEIDKIPPYAHSIQQVLVDPQKLYFFLINNAPLVVELLIDANFLNNHSKVAKSKDSLFVYIESLKTLQSYHEPHIVDGVLNYQHNMGDVDLDETNLDMEHAAEHDRVDGWGPIEDDDDEDYCDIILSSKGNLDKGKAPLQDDELTSFVKQTLAWVINEAFKLQCNWIAKEHGIKVDIIMDFQENINWYKQPPHTQLEILVGVLYELQHDMVNCTNEFAILKYSSLQTPNTPSNPPSSPTNTPKG